MIATNNRPATALPATRTRAGVAATITPRSTGRTRTASARADLFPTPTPKALTYVTDNVLDGAWDDDRYGNILAILASLHADVIALQEAKSWDTSDFARVCETAEALGMESLFAASSSHECHLVLLYRTDKLSLKRWTPDAACGKFHHTLQRAEFVIRATGEHVTVLNTHLDPFAGDGRKREAGWLTEYAKDDTSCVLLGDLNTIGADDP
ncbi:endonuclease/exonuclease/phosphatase family protein, partial [Streptomyces sp. SID3343]|uniref:endonuclease/exonuclease/phosphatase family protein n=1 Tax=Streptomyces sp. SID3343 TaxID=2690260 RepID=UPI0013BEC15F|nr:hypothetical protein [Streptomyces sp. SID3343]